RELGSLSPVLARHAGIAGKGPAQSLAGPRSPLAGGWRNRPRHRIVSKRPPRCEGGRAEHLLAGPGVSVPAAGELRPIHLGASDRTRPLSARPVHFSPTIDAVSDALHV